MRYIRVLTDPSPEVLARHEKKIADRIAQHERRLIDRFLRLLSGGTKRRCDVCGAHTEKARNERCRGTCEG